MSKSDEEKIKKMMVEIWRESPNQNFFPSENYFQFHFLYLAVGDVEGHGEDADPGVLGGEIRLDGLEQIAPARNEDKVRSGGGEQLRASVPDSSRSAERRERLKS